MNEFRKGDVVTLLGSATRDMNLMRRVEWSLAERGVLVFPVTSFTESGYDENDASMPRRVAAVCATHEMKIRRSNAVLVVGEPGMDTRAAVTYAVSVGVAVYYLDPACWAALRA